MDRVSVSLDTAASRHPTHLSRKQQKRRKIRVGLSVFQEESIKRQRLRETCSAAWVDAQFHSIYDRAPDGEEIVVRVHDPNVYPPKSDTTPMKVCIVCEVPTPPTCVDGITGVCLDCHIARRPAAQEAWGASPWAKVMEKVRLLNYYLKDMPLAKKRVH